MVKIIQGPWSMKNLIFHFTFCAFCKKRNVLRSCQVKPRLKHVHQAEHKYIQWWEKKNEQFFFFSSQIKSHIRFVYLCMCVWHCVSDADSPLLFSLIHSTSLWNQYIDWTNKSVQMFIEYYKCVDLHKCWEYIKSNENSYRNT